MKGNIINCCHRIIPSVQRPLWDSAKPEGNVLIECGERKEPNHTP
jgi:hypothetical protein